MVDGERIRKEEKSELIRAGAKLRKRNNTPEN